MLEDLEKCEKPFTCPHGRPVIIKFSKYEIEKMVQEGAIKMKVTEKSKVIVIAGPTGSGKTEFSLMLAKDVDGEIINCDASQMKKRFKHWYC